MNKVNKNVLIFDLDGTLVNSAPDLAVAVNKTLNYFNRSTYEDSIIEGWVGNGAQILVERALSGSNTIDQTLNSKLVQEALEIFFKFYGDGLSIKSHLYEGVQETLNTLQQLNYIMTIVTNKPERFVAPILKSMGIDHFFVLTVGGDTLTTKKPDPRPLLYVCEQTKCGVENALMIGDSKNDILAAQSANMESIALAYGYNYGEDISLSNPTWVVETFPEVIAILNKMEYS